MEAIFTRDGNVIDFENIGDRDPWQESYGLCPDDPKEL